MKRGIEWAHTTRVLVLPLDESRDSVPLVYRSFRVDDAFVRRMNNAIAACAGSPLYLTQSGFVREWLEKGVEHLERRYNDGEPFPDAPPLPRGRRAGR